jgi:hypothetical protein
MRGWFDLVSAAIAGTNPPTCRGFDAKRLKGFEPSTFCMAIRQVSENRAPRMQHLAGDSRGGGQWPRIEMRGDMRRYAAIWELRHRSARNARSRFHFPVRAPRTGSQVTSESLAKLIPWPGSIPISQSP